MPPAESGEPKGQLGTGTHGTGAARGESTPKCVVALLFLREPDS